ncbi:jg4943 [Pararge aegeria aegeria]|uniref:Jg4943 protein n=1 Tax=Pararge aegeria aegeria TaxID=348720 RepID=A0A8S4SEH8_9NEOP|nr:jg4943 [Pararge aegeria aegeria]
MVKWRERPGKRVEVAIPLYEANGMDTSVKKSWSVKALTEKIYKGLDIVTAKASRQERELVPHHLLDILEPHQAFTVVDFRARSLKIIDNLTKQGKVPVIVGGTNYYIESIVYHILVEHTENTNELLWDKSNRKRDFYEADNLSDVASKKAKESDDPVNCEDVSDVSTAESNVNIKNTKGSTPGTNVKNECSEDQGDLISEHEMKDNEEKKIDVESLKQDVGNESKFSNEEIHLKLKAIDPVMASRLHPNNRRKVLRYVLGLIIFFAAVLPLLRITTMY